MYCYWRGESYVRYNDVNYGHNFYNMNYGDSCDTVDSDDDELVWAWGDDNMLKGGNYADHDDNHVRNC